MARQPKDERVVSQFDNRENSRIAMRNLLRFAQIKMESGVSTALPLDEIATAKEYFYMWHKKKPFDNIATYAFFAVFFTFIFTFNGTLYFTISSLLVVFIWVVYTLLELDKTKLTYVREMIGDMTNLSQKDKIFYLRGLREELWQIESEEAKKVFIGITFILALVGIFLVTFDNQQLKVIGFMVGVVSTGVFFGSNIIKTKKVKI